MGKIKLDNRLKMVASLVRNGKKVVDVGTDHAYLLAYLVENEICPSGIASDVKQGPLDNAIATVKAGCLEDKIECKLSNGLKNIEPNSCDDIVIAGMGGILITEILNGHSWIYSPKINIVVQPMTHAEDVRRFFIDNGFKINSECACQEGKRRYCAISASYTGEKLQYSPSYAYMGELCNNKDQDSIHYLQHQFQRLQKRYNAIEAANDDIAQVNQLKAVLDDFKIKLGGMNDD